MRRGLPSSALAVGLILVLAGIPIICLVLQPRSSPSADDQLIKLVALFRHGDRSPYMTFPGNPYPFDDLTHWPDGPDQLTMGGKKRMLDVGRFIRQRYPHFLPHNPVAVSARSSPADRCLNSAALVLAGAFPPTGRLRFDPHLDWQPVPVSTERDGLESMLNTPSRSPCPALKRAKELQRSAPDVLAFEHENQGLMDIISNHSNIPVRRLADVDRVYDGLLTAQEEDKRLPDWATEQLMQQMKRLDDKTYCVASSTPLIQRLETGQFYHELRNQLMSETGAKKVFFYSTHDSRMSSFLRTMNGYDGGHPPYGATLFFQLHQSLDAGKQVIRVYYLRETWSHEVEQLLPSGCTRDQECDASDFFSALDPLILSESAFGQACQLLPQESEETDCLQ